MILSIMGIKPRWFRVLGLSFFMPSIMPYNSAYVYTAG